MSSVLELSRAFHRSTFRRKRTTPKPNGVILYRGPSQLDGAPIVVIATGLADASANTKTGAMIQTWILRADTDPIEAKRGDMDTSICGDCPLRGAKCYVNVTQAPRAVFDGVRRGIYPRYVKRDHAKLFAGRALRVGSYGDPAAVPLRVWLAVVPLAKKVAGYTH